MSGMNAAKFWLCIDLLGQQAIDDIAWAESLRAPDNADDFATEVIFVICNSGMKNTIARQIFARVMTALRHGGSAAEAFGHKGKSAAMDSVWGRRQMLFETYNISSGKLEFLSRLPWIGPITKYHLAKNFGVDVAKPDVHLQRLADRYQTTPQVLCASLAKETGYRIATVDTVLWRACANGVLDSRTGEFRPHHAGKLKA